MINYIAATALIPELHAHEHRDQWIYTLPFVLGVVLMATLGAIVTSAQ
jgi:hypothetical protein